MSTKALQNKVANDRNNTVKAVPPNALTSSAPAAPKIVGPPRIKRPLTLAKLASGQPFDWRIQPVARVAAMPDVH